MYLAQVLTAIMILRAIPEKKEEKERIRLALLRAALQLAAKHGFASLGLREVARTAAIAPTSFYRHFADMDELGSALIEELVDPLLSQLADPLRRAAGRDQSAGLIVDAMLATVANDPALVRFLLAERVGASAARRAALAQKLTRLAMALEGPGPSASAEASRGSAHANAALALLLDGCGRALDCEPGRLADLRASLVQPVRELLAAKPAKVRRG